MITRHLLGIAAEKNVGAAAGHVGGDGNSTFAARLSDDARLALVLLGVEHLVRDFGFLQQIRDGFRFFNRNGADKNRLATFVIVPYAVGERIIFLQDAVDDGFELFFFGAVNDVAMLFANEGAVRGNDDNVEIIDFAEFGGFGFRGTGHAGKLF